MLVNVINLYKGEWMERCQGTSECECVVSEMSGE